MVIRCKYHYFSTSLLATGQLPRSKELVVAIVRYPFVENVYNLLTEWLRSRQANTPDLDNSVGTTYYHALVNSDIASATSSRRVKVSHPLAYWLLIALVSGM